MTQSNNQKNMRLKHNELSFVFYKKFILGILIVLFLIFSLVGFVLSPDTSSILSGFNKTVALFAFNYPSDNNFFLELAKFFAILIIFYSATLLFFSDWLNQWFIRSIQKRPYDLLIGYDEQNQWYLKNAIQRANAKQIPILILDTDNQTLKKNHKQLSLPYGKLRHAFISTVAQNSHQTLSKLKLDKLKNCIISSHNEQQNITLASQLSTLIDTQTQNSKQTQHPRLFVRVDQRSLSVLFKQNVLDQNQYTDLIPYSVAENTCKQLFSQHSILGLQSDLIHSSDDYHIILIGHSALCLEIIHFLAVQAQLPEENQLTIHCIDKQADAFCAKVHKQFTQISKIPHLSIKAINLDSETLDFYQHEVWQKQRLTNIIIADNEQDKNLDIAINLHDISYIKETTDPTRAFKTKVLFAVNTNDAVDAIDAIDNHAALSKKISSNQHTFANFYHFADIAEVSTREVIIEQQLDSIAKLIHFDYTLSKVTGQAISRQAIQNAWLSANLNDRESCKSQAAHIDIKLLALGLQKQKSSKTLTQLLENNQALFKSKLTLPQAPYHNAQHFPQHFPLTEKQGFEKLARAEHNRWNAFHYVRGWHYNKNKNKAAKQHDCLLPLEDFHTTDSKATYQYDMLAVINIPQYLAYAGYEISIL